MRESKTKLDLRLNSGSHSRPTVTQLCRQRCSGGPDGIAFATTVTRTKHATLVE